MSIYSANSEIVYWIYSTLPYLWYISLYFILFSINVINLSGRSVLDINFKI